MLPFNCSCVFVLPQASLNINFGIARDSDTQDMLFVLKMRRKKRYPFSFVHTELIRDKHNRSILTFT